MGKRKLSNPLALAVLCLLTEKPMHPYEISSTLRERAKEESIKINYGSLYSVVESLTRHGLIEVHETVRDGRRPERTVYAITDAGRDEFVDWESELLSIPVKEFTRFEAALALMPALSPDEVERLLATRRVRLAAEVASLEAVIAHMADAGMPELWSVEADYLLAQYKTELAFVTKLIERINKGTLGGIDVWRHAHEGGGLPAESDWTRATAHLRSVQ